MQEGVSTQFTSEQIEKRDRITAYYEKLSKTDQPIPSDETEKYNVRDIIEEARERKNNVGTDPNNE